MGLRSDATSIPFRVNLCRADTRERPAQAWRRRAEAVSTNMGNLEKLGILVIVILVVVVGVVAMTPKSTGDERLYPEQQVAEGATPPEALESAPADVKKDDVWPVGKDGATPPGSMSLPGGATASSDPKSPAAAETPMFRTVTVQAGDTPATIAKRELGNAARFKEILDANPGLVASKMKAGTEIKVPVSSSAAKATQASLGGMGGPTPSNGAGATPTIGTTGRTYVVKSGDTLMSIAAHELGGSKRWSEIAKSNEDVLHGSTSLKVGMKLQIPGDAGSSPAVVSRDAAPAAPSAGAATAGEREYVVKAGDTLWGIAKSEMGGESFLKELRAANQDVLKGSDSLKVGTRLKIPGKK